MHGSTEKEINFLAPSESALCKDFVSQKVKDRLRIKVKKKKVEKQIERQLTLNIN